MHIAIVEDGVADREHLLDCLAIYADDTKNTLSISSFNCAASFFSDGAPSRYDLIFLDIFLSDTDGMEIAKKLRQTQVSSQLVFVTTSVAHAVTSYEVAATYYLLKPYTFEDFNRMMQAVESHACSGEPFIAVKVGRDMEKIPLSTILFIDYADHCVQFHTTTQTIRSHIGFKEVADQLADCPQFLSCFRNVLLNMDKVEKLEGDHFLMPFGNSLPITRNCVREMREAYSAYIFSRMKRGDSQ